MLVYTSKDGVYVMAGHSSTHKQGKLPKGVALNIITAIPEFYELDKEHTKAVIEFYDPERDSNYEDYPNFWIEKNDTTDASTAPPPPPVVGQPIVVPDEDIDTIDAAFAFVALMRWIRELWR